MSNKNYKKSNNKSNQKRTSKTKGKKRGPDGNFYTPEEMAKKFPVSKDRALVNTKGKTNSFDSSESDPRTYISYKVMGQNNHPAWYKNNPQLIEDATKISFFQQLGKPVDLNQGSSYRVPGIMAFKQVTCPGYSRNANDPASIAAMQIYEFIRSNLNKPNPDYEPADIMMYLLAVDDIFSQYVNILRLFGIMNTWSADNLYTPQAIAAALYNFDQFSWTQFLENSANYKAQFNQLIYKASRFIYYPEAFTITNRHAWLFGNVFMDHDSHKAQMYAYAKANNWVFDETKYDTGTCLVYQTTDNATTMETWLRYFSACIDRLRNSSLVRTLVSDMRQAFSDANSLNMAYLDEGFTLDYSYDTEALMQIENMDIIPFFVEAFSDDNIHDLDVMQDPNTGAVLYGPYIDEDAYADYDDKMPLFYNHVINLHTNDTSVDTLVEATRGMVTMYQDPEDEQSRYRIYACADFCISAKIYSNPDDPWTAAYTLNGSTVYEGVTDSGDRVMDDSEVGIIVDWTAFDWAPRLWVIKPPTEAGEGYEHQVLMEWDHYASTGIEPYQEVIQRVNRACLLSLWSIPEFGAFNP